MLPTNGSRWRDLPGGNMEGVDYPSEGAALETQENPVEIAADYKFHFHQLELADSHTKA